MARATAAVAAGVVSVAVLMACSAEQPVEQSASPTPSSAASSAARTPRAQPVEGGATARLRPVRFRAAAAMADVRLLAGRIGPRLATGPAYRRAARVVARRFTALGYDVRQEIFPVPAGDSWGVPVDAGRSANVIAAPRNLGPTEPHVVVGAHLDTVVVAPGAEDNASGVAVLLELARLAAASPTRMPVVLVAFGGEEPRGPGDDMHHFGSRHHVRRLSSAQRSATVAMVALDRVGVGTSVPVCTGPLSPSRVQRELLRTAQRLGVPAHPCENTASDHWSFEKAGMTVARIGSTSYAGYHSAADVPSVVSQEQLGRVGRVIWAWLSR